MGRIIADMVMLNMAIIAAFVGRLLALLYLERESGGSVSSLSGVLDESLHAYVNSAGLLTLTCLITFCFFGFYTYGRAYRGRYKALVVFQAVTLSYLLFGFLTFFIPFLTPFPRSVLLSAWVLTVVALEVARVWAYVWKQTLYAESKTYAEARSAIRNILVIGGAGYIGSILVRKLLQQGYSVTVLDALLYGDESIRELYGQPRLEFVKGDFRDIGSVVNAMRGIDAVVHLGALVGDPACAIDEKLTIEINLAATRMIAEVAKGFGVQRFIFASTCSVYGASEEFLHEESELKPVSLYARTKISSEQALLSLAGPRFAPTIVRFATIFGWSPRPRFDLVVNLLTVRAMVDKTISIMGGQQWRPFLYVADAAEAIMRCLEAPVALVKGEIFNVGSDRENYQISQVGDMIKRAVPGVTIVTKGEDADKRNYRVSFKKFRNRVGFMPSKTVEEGIEEMKSHIEKGEVSDYRDPKYSNYRVLADEGLAVHIHRDDPSSPLSLAGNGHGAPSEDENPPPGSRPSGGTRYPVIKRALDILAAGVGLVLLSPLGFLLGLFIKLADRGPIFFGQIRIGQFGKPFRIWKFRSMVVNAEMMGAPVTGEDDPRITWLGRLLRKTKLDELPQLWNVLVGDMSLVGPRPEVPRYVERYTPEQREILKYKPGITDVASVLFRNEEALLRGAEDVEGFYLRYCLPKKIELNRQYAEHATLLQDLGIIVKTICPYWLGILVIYLSSLTFSFWLAYQLKSDFRATGQEYEEFRHFLPLMVLPQLILLLWRGQLRGLLSYVSIPEMRQTFLALGAALLFQVGLCYSLQGRLAPPPSILLLDFILSFVTLYGVRMTLRLLRERASRARPKSQVPARRVAIIGTGELATNLVLDFARSEKPARRVVAFFDDDPRTWQKRPHSIPVVGMPECLLNQEWLEQIDEVIVTLPEANATRIEEIGEMLKGLPLKVTIASGWPGVSAFQESFTASQRGNGTGKRRVGIIGAGDGGAALAHELVIRPGSGLQPVAFFDDDKGKWQSRVQGIPVLGSPERLLEAKSQLGIEEVIIAMPSASPKRVGELVRISRQARLPCRTVPSLDQLAPGRVKVSQLRNVEIQDMLGREKVEVEMENIRLVLQDRVVLVSGAGGSTGSELCRQIAARHPKQLLLLDRSQPQLFQIEQELIALGHGQRIVPLMGDTLDLGRMTQIFARFRPEVCFHAAAHNHVPMMESQPGEAIKNNSFATAQLADLALEYGVDRFVLISSDKAINPTSVMGATKRLAEMYIQALAASCSPQTKFMAVRFGNVLGSSASVVPVFQRQIVEGGPVKVTHPEMTRFFMTIPEACRLVLQSATQGAGGEIFVLDMGKPIKIVDLARQMIELSGLKPEIDIHIEFTGVRPGEKLFEEVTYKGKNLVPTTHPKICRLVLEPADLAQVRAAMQGLREKLHVLAPGQMKLCLREAIPEYTPYLSRRENLPATAEPE